MKRSDAGGFIYIYRERDKVSAPSFSWEEHRGMCEKNVREMCGKVGAKEGGLGGTNNVAT